MAVVLSAFASKLVNELYDMVKEEVDMILGVSDEIQKLRRTLRSIELVLRDAERRKIEEDSINEWLKELKDVMYDIDDILDRCWIEADKYLCSSTKPTPSKSKLRRWFHSAACSCFHEVPFAHEIGTVIKDLNSTLNDIHARKSMFDLKVSSQGKSASGVSRKTSSVVESDIFGSRMENDKQSILDMLVKEDTRDHVLVLAITGMGGIGKTTLAQTIFRESKNNKIFSINLWVCVSRDFNEIDLLRAIVGSARSHGYGDAQSKELLMPMVEDVVRGNKFLLVLDDVWNENIWEDLLRNPLCSGARGSRVLVTTRNEGIAQQMRAVHVHKMKLLTQDDGWALLCKKVATGNNEEDVDRLEDLGKKIVDKCDGLPLAIKTIGGVLRTKRLRRKDWEEVLQSSAWTTTGLPEGVKGALHLSYDDLLPQLKQCFLYCALFPEDHGFNKLTLVRMWIAEGFVEPEGNLTQEATGELYLKELVMRNLLQSHPVFDDQRVCKMHDLLHAFALFLMSDESLYAREVPSDLIVCSSKKLRRVSLNCQRVEAIGTILNITKQQKSIRTLLLMRAVLDAKDGLDHFKNLTRLRVFYAIEAQIDKLPRDFGNLIHLRYLNLSYCHIDELPEDIRNLRCLQFLILENCPLKHLPEGIVKLVNLRTLNIRRVPLEGLPSGIGNLKYLNVFQGFVVPSRSNEEQREKWCRLEEISSLPKLTELTLHKLERHELILNQETRQLLKDKTDITTLEFYCSIQKERPRDYSEDEIEKIDRLFDEALHPPSTVDFLKIQHFFGFHYPSWLTSTDIGILFPSLRKLYLNHYRHCTRLPPLGKLPNLEILSIYSAVSVTSVGPEFYGDENEGTNKGKGKSRVFFPQLTALYLEGMSNLEEWRWDMGMVAMPRLKKLRLTGCPKLKSLPDGLRKHATALTFLNLYGVNSLKRISGFSSLKELCLRDKTDIDVISDLPALKLINFYDPDLSFIPEWLEVNLPNLTALRKIEIRTESLILLLRCLMNGVDRDKIKDVPIVDIRHRISNKYVTYTKSPYTYSTNVKSISDCMREITEKRRKLSVSNPSV